MTFTCGTCWREFPAGWHSREQHFKATGHCEPPYECETCDRYFGSRQAVDQHMNALDHWQESSSQGDPEYECHVCHDRFFDEQDRSDHEVQEHHFCEPCDRWFENLNSIRQHLKSKTHLGSNVKCPFCGETRTTATGLIHHLERGGCSNAPLDRDKLYLAVRQRDPSGLISKKLLEWHGSPTYTATERTYNYDIGAYECYLCHRAFTTLPGLNQHLNSPIHQQNLYHCPNHRCGREFTTLAATINHLESESCDYMRFKAVQKNVEQIFDSRRMISF
ncbi:hypothetical protein CORC01_12221 [Colletotrichum orchidophilum]|uniref:C2H2-type domain-containing protein n=1 Tax=Colletotrichum orchidophilum TaxID=1209926 RepID=A0A1G4ATU1_9PEZI|nr:uncharacterized protein CORC01_12221 [Colletotrichum orchidophilum]OHE92503.1 hypothetical protein CORC01_12221 [Colletotrichum orchidophilum]